VSVVSFSLIRAQHSLLIRPPLTGCNSNVWAELHHDGTLRKALLWLLRPPFRQGQDGCVVGLIPI
jgi:hypothetical protein